MASFIGRRLQLAMVLATIAAHACKVPEEEQDRVAAAADLTTRQLLAGLNARNAEVLADLVVVTSTAGGPPRPLSAHERTRLVYPEPPYEYLGAGRSGTMHLLDGKRTKRAVELIRSGARMKVLGHREPLATYQAAEQGRPVPTVPGATDIEVIAVMDPVAQ